MKYEQTKTKKSGQDNVIVFTINTYILLLILPTQIHNLLCKK